jgi:TP901 family phage tail tape measure protein
MAQNEKSTTSIYVNTNEAREELKKLERSIAQTKEEFREMQKTDAGYKEKKAQLKDLVDQHKQLHKEISNRVDIIINGEMAEASMRDLRVAARQLRSELDKLSPSTQEFAEKAEKLRTVDTRIQELNKSLKPTQSFFAGIKNEIKAFGLIAAGFLGFDFITSQIGNTVRKMGELEDSLAAVRKTTGLTNVQVKELSESLGTIDTRTARKELLDLASDAGKIGLSATKDIEQFVRAGDKIKVALGEDLGQDAIKNIAKLNDLFGETQKMGVEQSMLATGSAINALGQAGTANEQYLVDFTMRIAGIATQAEISQADIIGLAATLDELGQQSETSSTALTQLFIDMQKNSDTYAKVAGLNVKEFNKLLQEDSNAAFIQFLDGINSNSNGLKDLATRFDQLGIDGTRSIGVIAALAQNTDKLKERQDLANKSFQEGTSITKEFDTQNQTFGATLDKLGKRISEYFVDSTVANFFKGIILAISDLTEKTDDYLQRSSDVIQANQQQAASAQRLLNEYETLTKDGIEPTAEEKQKLEIITLKLKDTLGESVVQINKETGALELNVAASKDLIKQKILLANSEASGLALKKDNLDEEIKLQQQSLEAQKKEFELRKKILADAGITQEQAARYYQTIIEGGTRAEQLQRQLSTTTLDAVTSYERAATSIGKVNNEIANNITKRDELSAKLKEFGFSEADIKSLFEGVKTVDEVATNAGKSIEMASEDSIKALEKLRAELATIETELANSGKSEYELNVSKIKERFLTLRKEAEGNSELIQRINADEKLALEQANDEYVQKVKEFLDSTLEAKLSKDEKELAAIADKFDKEIELVKGNNALVIELEAAKNVALDEKRADQKAKHYQDLAQAQDVIFNALLDDEQREVNAAADKWDKLILLADQNGIDSAELEKKKRENIAAITDKYNKKEKSDLIKSNNDYINEQNRKFKVLTSSLQAYGNAVVGILGIINASSKDSAEFQKGITVAQLFIDSASAISSVTAQNAKTSLTPIDYAIRVATAIATVIANIGTARQILGNANTPELPGRTDVPLAKKGAVILQGPSHEQGGIKLFSRSGDPVLEAEGEEPMLVLSKAFYTNNRRIVDQMIGMIRSGQTGPIGSGDGRAIVNRGDTALGKFAAGGILAQSLSNFIPSFFSSPLDTINTSQLSQAVKEMKIEVVVKNGDTPSIQARDERINASLSSLSNSLARLNRNLENPTPVEGKFVYQTYKEQMQEIADIEADVTLSR